MTFAHPAVLLLLLLVPPVLVALLGAERRRQADLERFGDPALLARSSNLPQLGIRRRGHALRAIAVALLVVALARPQFGELPETLPRSGRDLLVLLDISRSMGAADVLPSRLAAARRATMDLVERLPGDRVGLIVFGGSAFLQLPLVRDQAAFRLYLEAASGAYLYDPSTDIAGALKAGSAVFEHQGSEGSRAMILVSDGESQPEAVQDVTLALRAQRIPVIAVGVGTPEGAPIPADSTELPERWHRDGIGRIVHSKLEEDVLSRVARETGGDYLRWHEGADLEPLAARLRGLEGSVEDSASTGRTRADRYQWPLALGVLLLLVELLLGVRGGLPVCPGATGASLSAPLAAAGRQVSVVALLFSTAATLSSCAGPAREARRGEKLYAAGNWRESYEAFERGVEAGGGEPLEYNAGNALYRMRQYEEAIKRFRDLPADSTRLAVAARFNLGNAYVRAAEEASPNDRERPLRLAVAAFEDVLRRRPGDLDAKWNLELAVRRLASVVGDGSTGRGGRADYGRGRMDDPNQEGNEQAVVGAMAGGGFGSVAGESARELTPEEARRLLESVQREQSQTHEGRPGGRGSGGGKDW